MSHIQLLFDLVQKDKKTLKLSLSKNYNAKCIYSNLPYLNNIEDPSFQNFIIDVRNSREDLQKLLLGLSDIGDNIREGIN